MTAVNIEKLSFYEKKFADNVIRMYPFHTDYAIAKKIGTTSKTVSRIAKKLSLIRPKQSEMVPNEMQKSYIIKNASVKTYSAMSRELSLPRHIVTRWTKELIGNEEPKASLCTVKELEEHYHILCMWYLRGFDIRDIVVSYCGAIDDEDVINALTFRDGKIFKSCYLKIKFAGNDVFINDNSSLGALLKDKVKKWDDYLSKFEVKIS